MTGELALALLFRFVPVDQLDLFQPVPRPICCCLLPCSSPAILLSCILFATPGPGVCTHKISEMH